ncbi:MAG TPA: diacylglycerol kinase family protein [Chthonomonadaceae bacterium]|nr:diacylglycerol kinase family protein [Chthonomonadaceae bacterium]
MRRVHVIINPISGQPKPVLYTLNSVFREAGVAWDVSVTQNRGDACRAAKKAAAQGVDVVAAYGGDGTVLEAATGLLGTTTPLAILPGGTANILSVELGIPHDLAAAARIACREDSPIRKVDLGQSGEQFFIQRIGIGLDADKVNRATRELKQKYGRLAYSIGWLQAVHETPRARYRLRLDGREEEAEGVTCHIANAGSTGVPGLVLLPDISVSDGLLDVLVVRDVSIGSALSIASIAAGHPIHPEAFHHWQAREITVSTDSPQRIHADGEMWEDTPITVQVLPEAVSILTPSAAQ